jgi:DNA polymerase
MAKANRLDLAAVYPTLWELAADERKDQVEKRYQENKNRNDKTANELSREAYIAADLIKIAWRLKHPGTVRAWRSLLDAAFAAVNTPNVPQPALGVPFARYIVAHGFLWLQLPSGRCLAYGIPEVRPVEVPWADKTVEPSKREKQPAITVCGVGANNNWSRYPLNISILYNNLVQATARDLLVNGIMNVERHGYPVRLHVHDEAVAEVPNGFGSVEEFERLMCAKPEWAKDLPLAASGFTLKRYAKA